MADMLVVGSKVKAFIKAQDCMTAGETLDALSKCVEDMLVKACQRCKANKRATVKAQDL